MKRSEYEAKMADLQNQIEELKKVDIEEDDKRWKPSLNERYYYVSGSGQIPHETWIDTPLDKNRYAIGNCFKTYEDAEFVLESLKVNAELRKFAERDGAKWGDDTEHYYIYYDFGEHIVDTCWTRESACAELYFATEQDAEKAIEAVGEKRIKKYYLGIKEGAET